MVKNNSTAKSGGNKPADDPNKVGYHYDVASALTPENKQQESRK